MRTPFGKRSVRCALLVALLALGACGEDAVPVEPAPRVIREAVQGLANPDAGVRAASAQTLGARYPEGAIASPLLELLLTDGSAEVRQAAQEALVRLASKSAHDIAEILANAGDPRTQSFIKGMGALFELGARATPHDMAKVETRASRCMRMCLTPLERDRSVQAYVDDISRAIGASDAGLRHIDQVTRKMDGDTRAAAAALTLMCARSLPAGARIESPGALLRVLRHTDGTIQRAGLQLWRVVRDDSAELASIVRGLEAKWEKARPIKVRGSVAELLNDLPAPEAELTERALSGVWFVTSMLDRRSRDEASAALPRLRALFERVHKHPELRDTNADLHLAACICRIDKPKSRYVKQLASALDGVDPGKYLQLSRARLAMYGLAGCDWRLAGAALRAQAGGAAVKAMAIADVELQGVAAAVLLAVPQAAATAGSSIARALAAADKRFRTLVTEVRAEKRIANAPGELNAVFVAQPIRLPGDLVLRRRLARLLVHARPLSPDAQKALSGIDTTYDPFMAVAIAAGKRAR